MGLAFCSRRVPSASTEALLLLQLGVIVALARASPSVMLYTGKLGAAYNDSNYAQGNKSIYALVEGNTSIRGHPSYSAQTPKGDLLLSGDSFGDGSGRGWANVFDENAMLKWAWHSQHTEFDAVLGAAVLPDETVVLGGTRSISGRWELLLVAVEPNGNEKWATTLTLKPPSSSCADCWAVIYWMDVDPTKELLIMGGVVDHQPGAGTFAWKSGGGQPDQGGVPFVAAVSFSKLGTAPTTADFQTTHYFDKAPGYTTVVSLRAERGKGVIALLPLNPVGGSVARLTYDHAGNFFEEWVKPLSVQNQVTDISIVGDNSTAAAYVVSATVNPGAKIESVAPDGSSTWIRSYDIKATYPPGRTPKGQQNWCQECWSIATLGEEVMLSCGVAELDVGDTNCDDGLWRSLLVTFNYHHPGNASFRLFHSKPDQNFAVEYASFGANGEAICAIDADSGGSIVRAFRIQE